MRFSDRAAGFLVPRPARRPLRPPGTPSCAYDRIRVAAKSNSTAAIVLGTDADEILVKGAKAFRSDVGPNEHGLVSSFNEFASARFPHD